MEPGDQVRFQLRDGRPVTLLLEDTGAAIVEKVVPGGIVYRFSASVRIDGQPMTLERFVCSQECFYEPYVVNGLRIWLDIVKDVFDLIPVRYPRQGNLRCRPRKSARLALQDASLRICPEEVNLWIEHEPSTLDVGGATTATAATWGPTWAGLPRRDGHQPAERERPVHPDHGYPGLFQQPGDGTQQ